MRTRLTSIRGLITSTIDGERYVGVVEASGIGDEDPVRCIDEDVRCAAGEESGMILFEERGMVRVTPEEGSGELIVFDPNMIGVVDSRWEGSVLRVGRIRSEFVVGSKYSRRGSRAFFT